MSDLLNVGEFGSARAFGYNSGGRAAMSSNRLVWIVGGVALAIVLIAGFSIGPRRAGEPGSAGESRSSGVPIPTSAINPAHVALLTATETQRRTALAAIVTSSGLPCENGRGTFAQGMDPASGDAWWNLDCGPASRYVIRVKGDKTGSSIVMDCRVFEQVTGNRCFVQIAQWK